MQGAAGQGRRCAEGFGRSDVDSGFVRTAFLKLSKMSQL